MKSHTKTILLTVAIILFVSVGYFIYFQESSEGLSKEQATIEATLPPDPGSAGRATLEGIDSDGDGVRDDIQRFIELNYPDRNRLDWL